MVEEKGTTKTSPGCRHYLSKRQNLEQIKRRQNVERFIHRLETWGNTKERQNVDSQLPVTGCRQKNKSLQKTQN